MKTEAGTGEGIEMRMNTKQLKFELTAERIYKVF